MMIPLPAILLAATAQGSISLAPQGVISRSGVVERRVYPIPTSADLSKPAVEIRGDNVTIDFNHAVLEGTPQSTEPDRRKGLGLSIHGKNVTVKNLVARGYKVGLIARDCPGLRIIDSDFSYSWKQHLASTLEREDESDWQSYHHNEKDEWLRYGAGIYLRGCTGFEIKGCKAEGGQCGLMMTSCDKGKVWNCDFSFLSGIGVGMYRSSNNRIMHNKIDWCVRGFSYGVYNRGQDSAGILIYEQSNANVFAYNSVTHGGDGFFLWAGQTTMGTGEGGCNDNLLFGNDFSHSPANGIESTFSRNDFVNNLMLECWHGIWGGYSYDNKVVGNVFGHNEEAIAWEHGQDNLIDHNEFTGDNTAINTWGGAVDPNFVYAKKRDTRNMEWTITNNEFMDEHAVLVANRSDGIRFTNNLLQSNGTMVQAGERVTGLVQEPNTVAHGAPAPLATSLNPGLVQGPSDYLPRFRTRWNPYLRVTGTGFDDRRIFPQPIVAQHMAAQPFMPQPLTGHQDPFLKPDALRGWRYILVDEWGPYDFKRPVLWPRGEFPKQFLPSGNSGPSPGYTAYQFEIIGPPGTWRLVEKEGVATAAPDHGTVQPGSLMLVTLLPGKASNIKLTLEYTGQATTDHRGIVTPAGKPIRFGYSKFFAPIDWAVRFYKWSKSSNPADVHAAPDEAALQAILKGPALKELHSDRLDFAGGSFDPVTGSDHFATVADGSFTVPTGAYLIEMAADDGARLWLDGKLLIEDAWHYQGPTLYSRMVNLGPGTHKLHVEHFQIDGYAALKVNMRPKK